MKYHEQAILFLASAVWVLFILGNLSATPDQSLDNDWSVARSERQASHPSLYRVALVRPW